MDIFFELHQDLPREGPGDNASTLKALSFMAGLPPQPAILDIGCGPGMQTIELAKHTRGKITAIDTHQPFLDRLNRLAQAEGVADNITTINMSMFALDFPAQSFNAIWSEGAIYIMALRPACARAGLGSSLRVMWP